MKIVRDEGILFHRMDKSYTQRKGKMNIDERKERTIIRKGKT